MYVPESRPCLAPRGTGCLQSRRNVRHYFIRGRSTERTIGSLSGRAKDFLRNPQEDGRTLYASQHRLSKDESRARIPTRDSHRSSTMYRPTTNGQDCPFVTDTLFDVKFLTARPKKGEKGTRFLVLCIGQEVDVTEKKESEL